MSETIGMLSIPTDSDGFVLLQCPLCGAYFKLAASDVNADDVIDIFCPSCGLKSENYFTTDVVDIAIAKTKNYVMDLLHNEFKKLERSTKGGIVSFSAGPKPRHESEGKVYCGIDALDTENYSCCKKAAKIDPLLKLCGSYCPYCGVRRDGN